MKSLPRFAVFLAIAAAMPMASGTAQTPSASIYYSPATNLETIDIALIGQARTSIDLSAFVLSDYPVLKALVDAADRGVAVRLYLDATQLDQLRHTHQGRALGLLAALSRHANVLMRQSAPGAEWMHLKGYLIDGTTLRTGSANLSASGERYQDNDLVVLNDAGLGNHFLQNFEQIWFRPGNQEVSFDR